MDAHKASMKLYNPPKTMSTTTQTKTATLWCLLFCALMSVTLVTSETTPRCQTLMTSLTCPANRELEQIQEALNSINLHFENITQNLEKQETNSGNELLPELHQLQTELLNVTSKINKTWGINEDFQSVLRNIVSPEIDIKSKQAEAFQIAIVCLWLELQGLMKNVTRLSMVQTSAQLTNNVRWSDIATQISYLQQHMASANQNISIALTRVGSIEKDMTSLQERLNTLNRNRQIVSGGQILNQTGGVLTEQLLALKSKLAKNGGKIDEFQTTLGGKHFNAIPQYKTKQDHEVSHKILDMLVKTDGHLVNVTMATVLMEHELASLRLNVEERLAKMEDDVRNIKEIASSQGSRTSGKSPVSITAATCNGSRRHLVGTSCYYIPLVEETETRTDTNPTWWDARYLCKQGKVLGPDADLVAIETRDEMEALSHLIDNHFGGIEEFWIGGSDLDMEGSWHWAMTSDAVGFSNWGRAPSASVGQNCMSMLRGLKWAAEPCFYRRRAICELKLS